MLLYGVKKIQYRIFELFGGMKKALHAKIIVLGWFYEFNFPSNYHWFHKSNFLLQSCFWLIWRMKRKKLIFNWKPPTKVNHNYYQLIKISTIKRTLNLFSSFSVAVPNLNLLKNFCLKAIHFNWWISQNLN